MNKTQGPFKTQINRFFECLDWLKGVQTELVNSDLWGVVRLTGSAGRRDSGKLKRRRRTEGCHKDVWEGSKSTGEEFKPKSFSMREWHHLLDIHLLKPYTPVPHQPILYVSSSESILYIVHGGIWIISLLHLCCWVRGGVWPYMVRSRGLLWKAPSGMEAISLLWNPLQEEGQGDSVRQLAQYETYKLRWYTKNEIKQSNDTKKKA